MKATLISKYFNLNMNVIIANNKAAKLQAMDNATAMEYISQDVEYVRNGLNPIFLTKTAAKEVATFLQKVITITLTKLFSNKK